MNPDKAPEWWQDAVGNAVSNATEYAYEGDGSHVSSWAVALELWAVIYNNGGRLPETPPR